MNGSNIYLTWLPGSGKTSIAKALNKEKNIHSFTMSEKILETAKNIYKIIDRNDFWDMTPIQRNIIENMVWKKHIEDNTNWNILIDGHLHIIHNNNIQTAFPYEKFQHIDLVVYIEKNIEQIKQCIQERNALRIQQRETPKKEYSTDELSSLNQQNSILIDRLQNDNKEVLIITPTDNSLESLIQTAKNDILTYLSNNS